MGVEDDARDGESVFDVGKRLGVVIETACVGKGTCGLCRVRIVEGESNLSPYSEIDEKHLGNVYHLTKVRLSCQAKVSGDVVVELAPKRKRKRGSTSR
jgi:ferredoxin